MKKTSNKGQVVQATGVARTVGTTGRLRNLQSRPGRWLKMAEARKARKDDQRR